MRTVILLITLAMAGCTNAVREQRRLEAIHFAVAYHEAYPDTLGDVSPETMQQYRNDYPNLANDIKSGKFTVNWGANLFSNDECRDAIFGYDTVAESEGGLVLFCDGTAEYLTAAEFRNATIAEPGQLKPKPLELEKPDQYTLRIGESVLLRTPPDGTPWDDGTNGLLWDNSSFLQDALSVKTTRQRYDVLQAMISAEVSARKFSDLQHYVISEGEISGQLLEFSCKTSQSACLLVRELLLTDGESCLQVTIAADSQSPRQEDFAKCVRTVSWNRGRTKP